MALLYGKPVADRILADTKERIETTGIVPGLAVVLVGDDLSSHLYVGLKEKAARDTGIRFEKFLFDENVAENDIIRCIDELNRRDDVHGIIVQLPLPERFDTDAIITRINPHKDADGFHPETVEQFLAGDAAAYPVFPRAMIELLRSGKGYTIGEKGLVIANSSLMGKVMVQALSFEGLESDFVARSEDQEKILAKLGEARVIVTACGVPQSITGAMIAEGTIIIDGGISKDDGNIVGDVERLSVEKKARWLSPVPGGVGPVTIACLLRRVLSLSEKKAYTGMVISR